jgi:hypothetical protein
MDYCENSDEDILDDIMRDSIPGHALVRDCCWRRICEVRGRNFDSVDEETWVEICRQRAEI